MATTDFIAAIELGSSKIAGIAGKKNSDGSIQVLAYAREDSSSFIRKGVIYNLDKTAQSLTSIINKLEGALNNSIAKIYVGIGGQSLRTVRNVVSRDLEEETIISQELVDSICDENLEIPLIDMDILDVAPQEYKIGNNLQADPVGVAGSHIEGRFLNIVARASLKKNLERCFEQAKIEIADLLISPLVTADAVLTESERRSGCALIDFGADTSTISIYKNNILRFLTVLPLGGNSITHDLVSLQMEEEEAERLKIRYGNAFYEEEEGEEPATCQLEDGNRTIELGKLNNIIEARTEEIIANVWNQIQLSGYDDKLLAGLIITGGAANLKDLDEVLRKRSKIEKVRNARFVRNTIHADEDVVKKDGTQNTLFGLLIAGNENCCLLETPAPQPHIQPQPQPEPVNMFEEDESLKEQEAAARAAKKKKEEEETVVSKGSVEEFVTLIRVYYQAVMAVQLGITNLNILNDMALFKRMLKIPTQNNKLGIAEKSRARKILMQEYGLNENFFKEIDASIKKNCRTQNDIKSYFIMYQGFNNDLFSLLDTLMQWKFRFSMLVKKLLYAQTQKTIHEIVTRSEWKEVSTQKVAWRIRKYKESLGYSEEWMTDFVYNVVLMAKEDAKRQRKEDK